MTTAGRGTEPRSEVRRALEAILFVSDEPVASAIFAQVLEVGRREVETSLQQLAEDYEQRGSGIMLQHVAGGWRLHSHPSTAPYVEQFVLSSRHARLTTAALETLAIVAYKQPVSRHQISSIRGVDSSGVLRALSQRGLVAEVGRDDAPGRPVLYGTTATFLERLGLPSLSDLPPLAPYLDASQEGDDDGRDDENGGPTVPRPDQDRERGRQPDAGADG